MILNDDPIVRCSRCGKDNKIPPNWFDGDSYSIGEFGMGARIQHDFYCEVECNNCGNQMSIMIHGSSQRGFGRGMNVVKPFAEFRQDRFR